MCLLIGYWVLLLKMTDAGLLRILYALNNIITQVLYLYIRGKGDSLTPMKDADDSV